MNAKFRPPVSLKNFSPGDKYRPYLSQFPIPLTERTWPNKVLQTAPLWCSVDLRDGNQALINPMNLTQKLQMFELLIRLGFKQIEIGFPSASATEFEFTRTLIEDNLIPEDVLPQVLVQARTHLIDRTFEALRGAKRAIVHLYNSTSELQRRVVFGKNQDEIIQLAVDGTLHVKSLAQSSETEITFEYSPESFTGTEIEFSVAICNAVIESWNPARDHKMIINLPSTVEMATPNIYADQIEYFHRNVIRRDEIILSLHPHNDRGCAVAAAELGLMAGGDRIEGTLLGNGERTGNVDIITLALNLFTQGVDPKLALHDLNEICRICETCTQLPVHPRHPYSGELVFTAFSGSHQDAIRKGMLHQDGSKSDLWEVPYLPIDPLDIGRSYEPIIRINSQSGKGGVAYRMETDYGFFLPKAMHPEFGEVVQAISDRSGVEVSSKQIWDAFSKTYLESLYPYHLVKFSYASIESTEAGSDSTDKVRVVAQLEVRGESKEIVGEGNGPIDAFKDALINLGCPDFRLTDFVEHALSSGSDAEAAAYIQIESAIGERVYGVGKDANTTKAGIKALLSALNRATKS